MANFILELCHKIQMPNEATESLTQSFKQLTECEEAYRLVDFNVKRYNQDDHLDFEVVFAMLNQAAELSGIHQFTMHLLFFLLIAEHTLALYQARHISEEIYYDSLSDLRCKALECHKVHHVWGTAVGWWHVRFFELNCFALGRLQFEIKSFGESYSNDSITLHPYSLVINIHIPSSGPLHPEDCEASYHKAKVFFKDYFTSQPTIFACDSWLLYPRHTEFLPPHSNILKFMNKFEIVKSGEDADGGNLWRIFYDQHHLSPQDLPRENSLQRAYADWLLSGNLAGYGKGFFVH